MKMRLDDYIDGDVAYLMGLIMARGTITDSPSHRQIVIEFPYSSLKIDGRYDQDIYIKLGLNDIRERLLDLLDTDIKIVSKENSVDLVARFLRPSMVWRDILLLTGNKTSYPHFQIPPIFFEADLPREWKREFVRGFADVAGNIRESNRYVDGRNRVRLDILNYPTNWSFPVQLCTLLQEHLDVSVQLINWGHPNLGRAFREHQLNVFAKGFLKVGFSFQHKQETLKKFAEVDEMKFPQAKYEERLDSRLVGNHYDAYWQICRALGCARATAPVAAEDESQKGKRKGIRKIH
jgi:hypothetical protein